MLFSITSFLNDEPIVKLTNGFLGEFNFFTIFIRLFISLVFASLIGIERANKRHSAGLRTFIIVSIIGTIAGLSDEFLMLSMGLNFPAFALATIVGVALISSNTLLFSSRSQIKGLTTSVALYLSLFIGIVLGFGLYTIALFGFLALNVTVSLLPHLETYLKNRSNHFDVHLELKSRPDLQQFITTIRKLGLIISDIEFNPAYHNSGLSVYTVSIEISNEELKKYKSHKDIIDALKSLDYVNDIEEI